jgi:GDP-L-fucose synthase
MGELQAEAYRIEHGWARIAIVRPSNVYGPYDNFDLENAMVVPSLVKRAVDGDDPLVVWGDGSAERDFVHARDVAAGMLAVAARMPGHPVNLGSGEGTSIRRLVDAILGHLDRRPAVRWDASRPTGDRRRVMDVSRARALGWRPAVALEAGLAEVMDWYRTHRGRLPRRYDVFERPG